MCDEIINAAFSVSTNVPTNVMNFASINVTSVASINFRDKKVTYKMGCHVLHTGLFVVILLFII